MARTVLADGLSILTHTEPVVQPGGAGNPKPIQDRGAGKKECVFRGSFATIARGEAADAAA
ncbi:MAG TPA: hypothetical protein VN785_07530 [Candidatus Angelobacter sp.]|nr:hypothetical protein [Candidatus Angelobacter sp.]